MIKNQIGIKTEFGTAWLDRNKYYYISTKINGKWTSKPLHILIYEKYIGKIPKNYIIYHKDFNPNNNNLTNLESVSKINHRRIHAGWIKTKGEWSHKKCYSCKKYFGLKHYRKSKKKYGWGYQCECKFCDNIRRVIRQRNQIKKNEI